MNVGRWFFFFHSVTLINGQEGEKFNQKEKPR